MIIGNQNISVEEEENNRKVNYFLCTFVNQKTEK